MNDMVVSDIRCLLALLILLFIAIYTIREGIFTVYRRIRHIYLWTDIRYQQMIMVFFTIFSTSVVLYTFNDLQILLTTGTIAAGWFSINDLPGRIYGIFILCVGGSLLVYNYVLFGRRVVKAKKKGKQILAEMVPLTVMVACLMAAPAAAAYLLRLADYLFQKTATEDAYGVSGIVRASFCIAAFIFMIFDAKLAKRRVIDLKKLTYQAERKVSDPIWDEEPEKEKGLVALHEAIEGSEIKRCLKKYGLWGKYR